MMHLRDVNVLMIYISEINKTKVLI